MTPLDGIATTLVHVAGERARAEHRPIAVERDAVSGGWTVRPESEPTPGDYVRLAVVRPEDNTEDIRMGVAKRVATALQQGEHIAAPVLAMLGPGKPPKSPELVGDTLLGAIESKRIADTVPRGVSVAGDVRDLQAKVLSLDVVKRFVAEHGDRKPLAKGLPTAKDLATFDYPNLRAPLERFIRENPDPEPVAAATERERELLALADELRPAALAANASVLAAADAHEAETAKPSRKELALRRSNGTPNGRAMVTTGTVAEMIERLPLSVRGALERWLATFANYRDELRRWRAMDRELGNDGRYVAELREKLRPGVLDATSRLRDFCMLAPGNGIDPFAVLRALATGDVPKADKEPPADLPNAVAHLDGLCPFFAVQSVEKFPDGIVRRRLANGWFLDSVAKKARRHLDWRYSVWEPGASKSGSAEFRAGANTLAQIVEKLNAMAPQVEADAAASDQAVHEQEQRLAAVSGGLSVVGWQTDPDRPGYTRRYLRNGWFIEHEPNAERAPNGHVWSLWNPGAADGGFAAPIAGGTTFAELVDAVAAMFATEAASAEPAVAPVEAIETSPTSVVEPGAPAPEPARRGRRKSRAAAGQGSLFD